MDRRTFIAAIMFGVFGTTRAVRAQQAGSVRRIGFLREGIEPAAQSLRDALGRLGWIENEYVTFEYRYALSRDQLPGLAADLVRRKVDLIIAVGTRATRAVKEATVKIPIVFSVGGNPMDTGLVASMSSPGGNLTGFALGLYGEKQLQVLKAALPGITRVAYPALGGFVSGEVAVGLPGPSAQKALGIQTLGVAVDSSLDFASFFSAARQSGAEAALIHDVALLVPLLKRIGVEASRSGLPAMGFRRLFTESGGLMSYAPLMSEQSVRMAFQISKILNGAKAADLPVEQPTRFELVINLREAKALGVSIPRLVRLSADELIE